MNQENLIIVSVFGIHMNIQIGSLGLNKILLVLKEVGKKYE